jgi:hypothetical protein
MRKLRRCLMIVVLSLCWGYVFHLVSELYYAARRYEKDAAWCARMENRCQRIAEMDPETLAKEASEAFDDPYLNNPEWARKMIPWFAKMRKKYEYAVDHPWITVQAEPVP